VSPDVLAAVVLALGLGAAAGGADPCSIVGRNDVAAVLGGPVLAATPSGPMRDAASGGRIAMCTYDSAGGAVVVSVTTFATADLAGRAATRAYVAGRLDGSDVAVSDEGGIGDRAFFGVSSAGARWVVLRGTELVEVAAGGAAIRPAASAKGRLRGLVAAALSGGAEHGR